MSNREVVRSALNQRSDAETARPVWDAASAYRDFLHQRRFGSLDGLRTVSVIAVIWHHCNQSMYGGILSAGYTGVYLFFAISGFLITTLLLRERDEKGEISLRNFYIRRSLRIFPLYYAVVALYLVLILTMDRHSDGGRSYLHNLPYFLSYTTNWFIEVGNPKRIVFYHAWSLATEEQFYLLWPWIIRFSRGWRIPVAFMIGLLVVDQVGEQALLRGILSADPLWVRILTSIAAPICMGCLFALLLHHPRGFRLAYRLLGRRWSVPLLVGLLLLGLRSPAPPHFFVNLMMASLVTAVCIREDHVLRPLLGSAAAQYIGMISYGMYLLHVLPMNVAERILKLSHPVAEFLVVLPLTVIGATLSYRLFERPFLKRKAAYGGSSPGIGTVSPRGL